MRWMKKWYYLTILIVVGFCYFGITKDWKFYSESLQKVKDLCDGPEKIQEEPDNICLPEKSTEYSESEVQSQETETIPEEIPEESETEVLPEGPVFQTVDESYFEDAVFIGDSRTVGLYEYGGLEQTADFCATTGLTVYKLFQEKIDSFPGQKKKITIEEVLQNKQYGKIYFMIGINEMGTGTVESFVAKYQETIDRFRELQPDAVIYIQAIMKVTTERSNQGDYITNEGIEARNLELEKLADNRTCFYLDVNPILCDEDGGLVPDYTFDGVHLKAQYIEIWKNFLMEHAVVK